MHTYLLISKIASVVLTVFFAAMILLIVTGHEKYAVRLFTRVSGDLDEYDDHKLKNMILVISVAFFVLELLNLIVSESVLVPSLSAAASLLVLIFVLLNLERYGKGSKGEAKDGSLRDDVPSFLPREDEEE